MTVIVAVAVIGLVVTLWFQSRMKKALIVGAARHPVGTVETYTYTGKSGVLTEQLSAMSMERHINLMITNGWDVVNQTGLPGHIRLGRTATGAVLTGGLSVLAGGSRTADRVSITFRRVQIPVASSGTAQSRVLPQPASNAVAGYCNKCGSALQVDSRFCTRCGAAV
jgi:zinc-ribbon domain